MAVLPEMEGVLNAMAARPLAERVGTIDGVMIKTFKKWADQRGYFIEQLKRGDRDDEGRVFLPDQQFAQMSRSLAFARGGNPPELIKAFHWHKRQWDYWDIVQGDARVVLVDLRHDSPTAGRIQSVMLGEHAPRMVAIPPLVAHGYQCLSLRDVILNYYVTEPYSAADPDEGRIAWDDPGSASTGRSRTSDVRLLVTGGAGFIGSEFVRMTLRDHPDDSVVVLDKLTYAGNERNLDSVRSDERFRFVHGDICDAAVVRDLAADVDVIVNFAAESHVDRSLEAPGQFILTDVYGTFILMDAARAAGHERFVQVEHRRGVWRGASGLSVEGDPLQPRSPYSASKAGGELQVQAYRTSYGFPAIVTRGSNTYGPYQYPEKIIPLFITNAIDDRPLPIYGDGGAVRDYLFVEDHARGIDSALRSGTPGTDYNIGAGGETDGVTVADTVLRLLNKPASLKQFVRDRPGHDRRYALDSSRFARWDGARR